MPCRLMAEGNSRLHYVGCGGPLLLTATGNLNATLMPDFMHPTPTGCESAGRLLHFLTRPKGTAMHGAQACVAGTPPSLPSRSPCLLTLHKIKKEKKSLPLLQMTCCSHSAGTV